MNTQEQKSVLVGMSGGVDSSVCAALLCDEGYMVEGVTLNLFNKPDFASSAHTSCFSQQELRDAQAVCQALGIKHRVYSYQESFESLVISHFCNSYLLGETPNPCIVCNREVKFRALHELRESCGSSFVSTGHYVRSRFNEATQRFELLRARDIKKDQSYFLYKLRQEDLAHTLFPLGNLTKDEVRERALNRGLVTAHKTESQDICFLHDESYASFIARKTDASFNAGPIINRSGEVLGTHRGLIHYTIGQRKGIGLASSEPLYVVEKRVHDNTLVVDVAQNTWCKSIIIRDVNFVSREHLEKPEIFRVKTHSRQTPQDALVERIDDSYLRISFSHQQRVCAPGQAAVIYEDDAVVCGGTIDSCT